MPSFLRAISVPPLVALAFALCGPAPAQAGTSGYAEPAYTKTAGNNAYWWHWNAITGANSGGATDYTYYLCLDTYANGAHIETSSGSNGPGTANCTGTLRSGPNPSAGDYGALPLTTGTVLTDGAEYSMCATGY